MGLEFQIVMLRGEPLQNIPGKCAEYYGKTVRNKCKKCTEISWKKCSKTNKICTKIWNKSHGNATEKVRKTHGNKRGELDRFVADRLTDLL